MREGMIPMEEIGDNAGGDAWFRGLRRSAYTMAKSFSEFTDGKTLIMKFDSVNDTLSVLCYDEEDKIDEFGTCSVFDLTPANVEEDLN